MMRVLTMAILLATLSACSSAVYGSAPAREGYVYAVGAHNGKPMAWLCPANKKGECVEIAIQTDE
jgi:hypothetical protein